MAKFVNTKAKVVVNNVDLSDHAFGVDTPQSKEQVDVSGFSATNTKEFLAGTADQTITVKFLQDFSATKVHATLNPLFAGGSVFPVYVMADSVSGTSATNPLFGGSASLFEYNGLSGDLNARSEITATFKPAGGSSFAWGTVAP